MNIAHRKLLVSGLLLAFATQGAFVYTDSIAANSKPFSAQALEGRALWHANNCGACHQIHGFGGFLGPDLTNAAQRLSRARLDEVLTRGTKQMPAFHFDKQQVDVLEIYLRELDKTGIGQSRAIIPPALGVVNAAIERRIAAAEADPAARRGRELFVARCSSCHVPLRATPLGPFLVADPSAIATRLSPEQIEQVLVNGRPERGMVPTGLDEAQRKDVIAYLCWLAGEREALKREGGTGEASGLPWWEFK